MKSNGIQPTPQPSNACQKSIVVSGNVLTIGSTEAEVWPDTEFKSKVPQLLFYNIQQHVTALEELLRDYLLGQHLLLVGNQGVGKNK